MSKCGFTISIHGALPIRTQNGYCLYAYQTQNGLGYVLNHEPCHLPLKYRCSMKDHIRQSTLKLIPQNLAQYVHIGYEDAHQVNIKMPCWFSGSSTNKTSNTCTYCRQNQIRHTLVRCNALPIANKKHLRVYLHNRYTQCSDGCNTTNFIH